MGVTNTLYACLNSQTNINQILTSAANPLLQMQQTLGVTNALKSSVNTAGFQVTQGIPVQSNYARPTSTSNRKVTVQGRVKGCPTVVTSKPDPCAGETPETSDLVDSEVTVENGNWHSFTLNRQVYQDTCDLGSPYASSVLAYKLLEGVEAVLKAENAAHIAAMLAGVNPYFSGAASTVNGGTEEIINLYSSTAPVVPQPGNMFRLIEQYRRQGYTSLLPIVTGGTILSRWAFDLGFYRGNVDGLDIGRTPFNIPTFIDYDIDSQAQAIGPNSNSRLMSWVPGHAIRLTYLDWSEGSPLRRTTDNITKTTMMFGDEVMDVSIYDAECDDFVDVTVGRYSDLYLLPSTFFGATDCGGQQGLHTWLTPCADTDCDDILLPENVIT